MSEEKAAAAPKSKKGLLIIILSVVVLAGAGAGVYFGFMRKSDTPKTAAAAAAEAEKKPKLPAQFVPLDPPFVVNFEPGSSARFLQVSVQLMTRSPEMVEFLKNNTPIIKNDLLLLFGNKHVEEVSTEAGKEALRAAALDAVRKIIKQEGGKPEELEAVYFTSFVMQ